MTEPLKSLKILQIVDEPWDSGLTNYALSLSRGLRDAGHEVTIAVRPGQAPSELARQMKLETWLLSSWPALRKKIVRGRYDIVNAHTGKSHAAGWFGTRGTGARLIRTRGDARALRRTPFWRLLYRGTRRVIACSDMIRTEYLRRLELPVHQVVTIHPDVASPGQWPPYRNGPLRVGIVARLDPVKGHRDFIQAAALLRRQCPDSLFVFAGGEANVKILELQALAENLGLAGACSFLGWRRDISQIMQDCDIGVIASIGSEAVSRAALEWMASGRPVVAAKIGCLPEIVADGLTGFLVPPGQPKKMAAALIQLAQDPVLKARMGRAAWERAHADFSTERLVSNTLRVYRETLLNLP
jgi:glycosyltransferase involved in cell wall biosynthesis